MSFLTGNNLDVQKVQLCEVEFTTSKEPAAVSNKSPDISISKWFTLCLSKSSCGFFSSFFNRNKLFCFSFRTFLSCFGNSVSVIFLNYSAVDMMYCFWLWAAWGSLGIKLGSMIIWKRKNTEIPEWWFLHSLLIVVLLTRFLNCRDFFHSLPSQCTGDSPLNSVRFFIV